MFYEEWREVGLNQEEIPLSVNDAMYHEMEDKGILHILTMRDQGRLVGYYMAFVYRHPHYNSSGMMAFTDVYYLRPSHRRGGAGVALFVEAERMLKERGVVKAYISCKVDHDHSELFEHLGWRKSDYSFVKLLD